MPAKKLAAAEVGLPRFTPADGGDGEVFSLSSHRRAREALEFGLSITDPGFNIFVLGEDRSGRMTVTLEFLHSVVALRPPPNDWIYLNNFQHANRPRPYRLPAGVGHKFRDRMAALLPQLRDALGRAFGSDDYQMQVQSRGDTAAAEIAHRMDRLRDQARENGLALVQTPEGGVSLDEMTDGAANDDGPPDGGGGRETPEQARKRLAAELQEITQAEARQRAELADWIKELDRQVAEQAVGGLFDALIGEYSAHPGLARWLAEMRVDFLDNVERARPASGESPGRHFEPPEQRYAVNLLVDHADDEHPVVVLEANPTYENLFGRIEYRQQQGVLQTDFSLIRPGSLHRANGGVLVLRAESLAGDSTAWGFLKAALRDMVIRVEELHRAGSMPIAGAPRPKPIPLDVKVVIVGAPRWYYDFFSSDPDFQTHFKVKADIDADMDATPENLACYAALIRQMAWAHGGETSEPGAVSRFLGVAARWASSRDKLTARFELIEDLVSEAALLCAGPAPRVISEAAVVLALANRRRRNARAEDRLQESIARGNIIIDTTGAVTGQINALTVRDLGDHEFGGPSRVTARASVGRRGVINIERDTTLGGPIQQKGVMELQGFLAGHFARHIPLSFNCSLTFEQNYGGVEGDSASLAELLAILSDLAGVPLRQDLAVTGSVNQRGQAQSVGGVHHKAEGFFRSCSEAQGGLTGTQGVVVPAANEASLVLDDEVTAAVAAGRFHLWSVTCVEETIELFTGLPAGVADANGDYPRDSIYGRVMAQLASFDRILMEREARIVAHAGL